MKIPYGDVLGRFNPWQLSSKLVGRNVLNDWKSSITTPMVAQ